MRRRNVFLLFESRGRSPDYALKKRVLVKCLGIGLEKNCKMSDQDQVTWNPYEEHAEIQ